MDARIVGDYQITKKIGTGALGTVFLAEHRFMKRQYMLKVLPEELAEDRSFIQRFQEEVGPLAGLDHPNLVKIHNCSFAQGLYFLVSDCVVDEMGETTNLAQYLLGYKEGLPEGEVERILEQVAEALDYAHGKGLTHRGLKLNNILVAKGGNDVQVKLCDFGLTAIVGEAAVLTRTYRVVAETLGIVEQIFPEATGEDKYSAPPVDSCKLSPLHQSFLQSFHCMAPEQRTVEGRGKVDKAADVYAFGVLAYYLLTGTYPEGYFPLPSELKGSQSKWDNIIRRCMAADLAQRPESLVGVLKESPVAASAAVIAPAPTTLPEPVVLPEAALASVSAPEPVAVAAVAEAVSAASAPMPAPEPVLKTSEIVRPEYDPDPAKAFEVDPTVKQYRPERAEVKDVEPIQTEMAVVGAGEYERGSTDGSRDEMPKHMVNLNSFALDVHSVTNEQFVLFLEVMGGEKDHNNNDLVRLKDSRVKRSGGRLSIESGYGKHPVVGVTWYGAAAYAKWVGKRLPTEAEWEIASYPNEGKAPYPTGEDIEKSEANFFSSDTTPVMSYPASERGLFDMGGNVYEWCHDWYGYTFYEESQQEPDNPRGPVQGVYRVLRGGCWKSLKEDLRCSRRHRNNPGAFNSTYGFRCAADVVSN